MKKIAMLILMFISAMLLLLPDVSAATNLIKNGSFEESKGGNPTQWIQWSYVNGASEFKLEQGQGYSGKAFVTITNKKQNDARYVQMLQVKTNSMYKVSGWVKTENVGNSSGKGACISILYKAETSSELKGTNNEWRNIILYFKTGKDTKSVGLSLDVGGHGAMNTGKASFDDITVEEVSSIPAGSSVIDYQNQPSNAANAQSNSTNPNTTNASDKGSSLLWVIIIAVAVIIAGALYLVFINRKQGKTEDGKKPEVETDDDVIESADDNETADDNKTSEDGAKNNDSNDLI
jgi:hypothetical protein